MKQHPKPKETILALAAVMSFLVAVTGDPTVVPQWLITLAFFMFIASATVLALPWACDLLGDSIDGRER